MEMGRAVATLKFQADRWATLALGDGALDGRKIKGFTAGAKAYALKQAAIRRSMMSFGQAKFAAIPEDTPYVVEGMGESEIIDVTQNLDSVVLPS